MTQITNLALLGTIPATETDVRVLKTYILKFKF